MTRRSLETTREQCLQAIADNPEEGMERWLAQDAYNAHDLLDSLETTRHAAKKVKDAAERLAAHPGDRDLAEALKRAILASEPWLEP